MLWHRPWWTRPTALAAAWTFLLLYGSLIPFDLQAERFVGVPALLASPRWVTPQGPASSLGLSAHTSDLVANLVLYLPLGVLLRLAWASRLRIAPLQLPLVLAVAAATGLSWFVEALQSLSPSRVASVNDVLANAGAAAMGAAAAVWLREAAWTAAFAVHRRCAAATLPLLDVLRRERKRPGLRALALALAAGVAAWLIIEGPTATRAPGLPFEAEFRRPYDVAGILITQVLAAYVAIAALLAICFLRRSPAGTLLRLTGGIAVFTAAISAARWWLWGLPPNATEPAVAALAVGGSLAAAFTAVHAVRRRCRRRDAAPVAVDRRRRKHNYSFAIAR